MSSYLNFYVVPKRKSKEEPKKYVLLASYSRNNDIYSAFNDCLNIAWAGEEEKYTSISIEDINTVYNDLQKDIDSTKERLELYEKYAASNQDYIQEILETREYLRDLQNTQNKLSFLIDIVSDVNFYESCGIEEVCCNIN